MQEMDVVDSITKKNQFECEICNKILSRRTHLMRHMAIHTDERAFECKILGCGSKFRRSDHLQNHINARHTKDEIQSEKSAVICPEYQVVDTNSIDEFKDESNNIHSDVLAKQETDEDNNPIDQFEDDSNNIHSDAPEKQETDTNSCSTCGMQFKRKSHLMRHIKIHTDERAFECTVEGCDRKFRRLDHMKNHLNTHSPTKHECMYCGQTYCRADTLRSHIKARHSEMAHQNEERAVICPEEHAANEFKYESNNMHTELPKTQGINEDNDANKNKFECELCNKFFSRKTHLIRHMTIHTDERAFECIHCNQKFRRRDHLQNHLNTHTQLKTEKCSHCAYTTARVEHLRNHIRARHTEKPPANETTDSFNCPECNRSFSSQKNLKAHNKSHSTTFNCKRCDAQFSSKIDRNKHVSESHPNEMKMHLCSECGMTFTRHDYLLIHIRRHRGETRYNCKHCAYL